MSTATRLVARTVTREDLIQIANVFRPVEDGLSFHFCYPDVSDKTHRPEMITLKELVQGITHRASPELSPTFTKDLQDILSSGERLRSEPNRLHTIYACGGQNFWREFNLPIAIPQSFLQAGRRFYLLSLMLALESIAPFGVVLIESGKARAFLVRGTEIEEIPHRLAFRDLSLHAEDSRVGWSSHIDGNQIEHERSYFKDLAHELEEFFTEEKLSHFVIGCRDDLWGEEIEPHLTSFEESALVGRFHLPGFDITATEVLRLSTPLFHQCRRSRIESVFHEISELPARSAYGLNDVSQCLREGSVRCLLLKRLPGQMLCHCNWCGNTSPGDARRCIICGKSDLSKLPAEEGLIRQALLTDAEILFTTGNSALDFNGVAALLRY